MPTRPELVTTWRETANGVSLARRRRTVRRSSDSAPWVP